MTVIYFANGLPANDLVGDIGEDPRVVGVERIDGYDAVRVELDQDVDPIVFADDYCGHYELSEAELKSKLNA